MAIETPRSAARRLAHGFTLIEMLVVVAIIVVIVALAGVQLMRSPADVVRDESEHLVLLLRAAREEAILQGRVFAFSAGRDSYRFMRLERNGRLKVTGTDDMLRPKQLPANVTIESLKIEAGDTARDATRDATRDTMRDATRDGVVFLPSGELPAFRIVLGSERARWSIVGSPDGSIRAEAGS